MSQILTFFDSLSKTGISLFILFSLLITLGIALLIFSFWRDNKK